MAFLEGPTRMKKLLPRASTTCRVSPPPTRVGGRRNPLIRLSLPSLLLLVSLVPKPGTKFRSLVLVTLLGLVSACSPSAALDGPATPEERVSQETRACRCEESLPVESNSSGSLLTGDKEPNRSCQESPDIFVAYPDNSDVKILNARLQELNPEWVKSPVSLALRAVGLTKTGVRSVNVEYLNDAGKSTREGVSQAEIIMVLDEMDDSVAQTRWRFILLRSETGAWSYKSVRQEWICHRGRGQASFAQKLCL